MRAAERPDHVVVMLVVFVGLYLVAMVIYRSLIGYEPLDSRLLSPVFVPTVLAGTAGLDELLSMRAWRVRRSLSATLAVGGMTLLAVAVRGDLVELRDARSGGVPGFTSRAFQSRQVLEPACRLSDVGAIPLSNNPEPFSFWCGAAFRYGPIRSSGSGRPSDFDSLRERLAQSGPVHLVWLDDVDDPTQYEPNELSIAFRLTLVDRYAGAEVYEIALQ